MVVLSERFHTSEIITIDSDYYIPESV